LLLEAKATFIVSLEFWLCCGFGGSLISKGKLEYRTSEIDPGEPVGALLDWVSINNVVLEGIRLGSLSGAILDDSCPVNLEFKGSIGAGGNSHHVFRTNTSLIGQVNKLGTKDGSQIALTASSTSVRTLNSPELVCS
jgi:hypothetical protein